MKLGLKLALGTGRSGLIFAGVLRTSDSLKFVTSDGKYFKPKQEA